MADGKSKSDIRSDDVEEDDTFDDDRRTIGDDDAVRDWKFCTPVVINASTGEAVMAMAAKKWLIESFMVAVPIWWCVRLWYEVHRVEVSLPSYLIHYGIQE